jgi:hypothetical protein
VQVGKDDGSYGIKPYVNILHEFVLTHVLQFVGSVSQLDTHFDG